jgi:5-methylthioadenosine/S-adenosylhomocysteine deaminase
MNQLLIQNVSLFDRNDSLQKTDILIEGNYIKSLNPANFTQSNQCKDEIIDGSNFIALPGLMNCHTHIPMVLFRGFAEDLNLNDWLTKKIFPLESKLSEELVLYGALMGIAELIHNGCTFFADMYFFMESVAKAVDISGIRANLSLGLIDQNGEDGIRKAETFFNNYHLSSQQRIHVFFGPHAPYTCNLQYLKQISNLAKKLKTGIHIHLNETEKEVKDFEDQHHKRPIVALEEIGFFGQTSICAHCVHLDQKEISILKSENALVVHNPSSNMKLGSGIAPIPSMINQQIPVSLGTDGAASNNQLNMFKEMHMASLLSKVSSKDGSILPADTIFKMGTETPGQYLLNGKAGIIKENAFADIILINQSSPSLFPNVIISKSMIHSLQGNEVDTVIINGRIIMKGHRILTFDEKEIQKKANQLIQKTYLC